MAYLWITLYCFVTNLTKSKHILEGIGDFCYNIPLCQSELTNQRLVAALAFTVSVHVWLQRPDVLFSKLAASKAAKS